MSGSLIAGRDTVNPVKPPCSTNLGPMICRSEALDKVAERAFNVYSVCARKSIQDLQRMRSEQLFGTNGPVGPWT